MGILHTTEIKHTTYYRNKTYYILSEVNTIKMPAGSRLLLTMVLISTISIHLGSCYRCTGIDENLLTADYCVSLMARSLFSKTYSAMYQDRTADRIIKNSACLRACRMIIRDAD